jgi:hypothetical protein
MPCFRTWFSIDPQPASISPTINISIVFICAFFVDCGRIIRHPVIKNDSSAILITGRTFRNWFPFDSWNVGLSLVVCQVKDHVPKLTFVHKLTALWTLKEVFFFFVA